MAELWAICAVLVLMPLVISVMDALDVLPWLLEPLYSRLMHEVLGLGFLAGLFLFSGLVIFTVAGWLV